MSLAKAVPFAIPLMLSAWLHAEDAPSPLSRRTTGVSAAPQTLSEGAAKVRINRAAFEGFNPPPVAYVPHATATPIPVPSPPAPPRFPYADSASLAARRAQAEQSYLKQRKYTAQTDACPLATEDEKRESHERLERLRKAAGIPPSSTPRPK